MRRSSRRPGARLGLTTAALRARLEAVARAYGPPYLGTDPLELVRRYDCPEDREIAGLLAAALAYGRVASVRASVGEVFRRLGTSPRRFVEAYEPRRDAARFDGFRHRWTTGRDVALLLQLVARALERQGSLERFFAATDPDPASPTVEEAMNGFGRALFSLDARPFYADGLVPPRSGVRWLLPLPEGGSTCKRHCLFLRWMARPEDGLDCGLWPSIRPARLLVPLDTHMIRAARTLGWTRYRSPGWPMVLEVTAALRELDREDPTRFDFGLCRLGILGRLPARGGRIALRQLAAAIEAAPRADDVRYRSRG